MSECKGKDCTVQHRNPDCKGGRRASGEVKRERDELLELANIRGQALKVALETIAKLEARIRDLESRSEKIDKGRWCPFCKEWLLGLQSPGEACGVCHTRIEWRDLWDLMVEYRRRGLS